MPQGEQLRGERWLQLNGLFENASQTLDEANNDGVAFNVPTVSHAEHQELIQLYETPKGIIIRRIGIGLQIYHQSNDEWLSTANGPVLVDVTRELVFRDGQLDQVVMAINGAAELIKPGDVRYQPIIDFIDKLLLTHQCQKYEVA